MIGAKSEVEYDYALEEQYPATDQQGKQKKLDHVDKSNSPCSRFIQCIRMLSIQLSLPLLDEPILLHDLTMPQYKADHDPRIIRSCLIP